MSRDAEATSALLAIEAGARPADLESSRLDFKEDGRSIDDTLRDIAQASLCFANASGGVLVLGVADKIAGSAALKGTQLDIVQLQKRIYDLSRPPLLVDIKEETRSKARLLLVFIPQSFEIHSDPQGRAPRRIGRDCVPLDPQQQMRLREEKLGLDWSAQESERRVQDVAPTAIELARSMLAKTLDERRKLTRLSELDLLRALGVASPSGDKLLRAGDLLFCGAAPSARQPAITYEYRATPGGEPRAVDRLDRPLLVAFQRALELVGARRSVTALTLQNGLQLQIEDFPELAVREAFANAVIHRDYHLSGPVNIEHSPDVLKVTSPGPLVSGVTPENILTHSSKPRNPVLAKAVRTLGLAEEVGRGVDRMFREMIRAGRDLPRIESRFDSVAVTFVGGALNANVARFVAQLSPEEREDTDTLLTLFRLCSVPNVRAPDLASYLQKSTEECQVVLKRLATDSVALLEPTRQTARRAFPSYRLRSDALKALGTAVPYQRRTLDDIDRKIIAHVKEYRIITNRTIQNLMDVSLQRAKQILSDLVRREVLVKVSQHERGPGVEYGPGPKYPAARKKGAVAKSEKQMRIDFVKRRSRGPGR